MLDHNACRKINSGKKVDGDGSGILDGMVRKSFLMRWHLSRDSNEMRVRLMDIAGKGISGKREKKGKRNFQVLQVRARLASWRNCKGARIDEQSEQEGRDERESAGGQVM